MSECEHPTVNKIDLLRNNENHHSNGFTFQTRAFGGISYSKIYDLEPLSVENVEIHFCEECHPQLSIRVIE